jgi:hypothetical protein
MIEIVAGDHVPDLPFVIVDRQAATVDLTGIGELWDRRNAVTSQIETASMSVMKRLTACACQSWSALAAPS